MMFTAKEARAVTNMARKEPDGCAYTMLLVIEKEVKEAARKGDYSVRVRTKEPLTTAQRESIVSTLKREGYRAEWCGVESKEGWHRGYEFFVEWEKKPIYECGYDDGI